MKCARHGTNWNHECEECEANCPESERGVSPTPTLPIVPGELTIDPSDPEVQFILGRTCLTCGPIAHIFQRAGYPIRTRAEDETAHVLLWMLARYKEHGPAWKEKCHEELKALNEKYPERYPRYR